MKPNRWDGLRLVLCWHIDRAVESENLHWFVSHIDPLFISSSSDTTLLPPSKKPYSKYRSGDPDHVDIDKATSFLESRMQS